MQLHANDAKDPSHFNIQRHLINHENSVIENFMTKKVQQMAAENGFFYSLNEAVNKLIVTKKGSARLSTPLVKN